MDDDRYRMLAITREARVLTIAMNRPEALNAVDERMHEELSRVFGDAARDADTDVVVLTGTGEAFCAGGDIGWMQAMIDEPARFERTAAEGKRIVMGLLDCDKPVIARVNGAAVGLGATMALFCDIVVMADHAKIGDPHVRIGLVAGDGGALIWPQLVGYTRAKEYLLTGDLMSAVEAERIGLVNHAVPAAGLDAKVNALARKLADGARQSIRWTKASVNAGLKQIAHAALDVSLAYEALSNRTDDHREAVSAFRERRKPVFRGR